MFIFDFISLLCGKQESDLKKTLNEKIWYGVFVHHSYPVIAQEINSLYKLNF